MARRGLGDAEGDGDLSRATACCALLICDKVRVMARGWDRDGLEKGRRNVNKPQIAEKLKEIIY